MRRRFTERVKEQAVLWREGLEEAIREWVREVTEEILYGEVEEHPGLRRGQRASGRCGYRHGAKAQGLALRSRAATLAVPRARATHRNVPERDCEVYT